MHRGGYGRSIRPVDFYLEIMFVTRLLLLQPPIN
jgi:hypothetical protein